MLEAGESKFMIFLVFNVPGYILAASREKIERERDGTLKIISTYVNCVCTKKPVDS